MSASATPFNVIQMTNLRNQHSNGQTAAAGAASASAASVLLPHDFLCDPACRLLTALIFHTLAVCVLPVEFYCKKYFCNS